MEILFILTIFNVLFTGITVSFWHFARKTRLLIKSEQQKTLEEFNQFHNIIKNDLNILSKETGVILTKLDQSSKSLREEYSLANKEVEKNCNQLKEDFLNYEKRLIAEYNAKKTHIIKMSSDLNKSIMEGENILNFLDTNLKPDRFIDKIKNSIHEEAISRVTQGEPRAKVAKSLKLPIEEINLLVDLNKT